MTSYAAQLRVYQPLAAYSGPERRHWEAYAAAGNAVPVERGLDLEHQAALRALVGPAPTVLPDLAEQAFVLTVDGVTLVCPWRTRLRSYQALEAFLEELPDVVADAVVPRGAVVLAEQEHARWRARHPELDAQILTSTWHVPLRWFLLVDPGEREVRTGSPGAGAGAPPGRRTGRSLVYRTAMSRARRRIARALAVLRRSADQGAVTAAVEDLGRWLEEFHPRSVIELDYGGLVHLLDDAALAGDASALDLASAVAALGEGRTADAGAAYARVSERMAALQAVESAN